MATTTSPSGSSNCPGRPAGTWARPTPPPDRVDPLDPTAVLFGLASGATWGVGDFSGGLASRRTGPFVAMLGSQTVGLVIALAAVTGSAEVFPGGSGLAWGAVAGAVGAVGLLAFYAVLARGQMVLGAPLVAVIGAGVPAGVGLWGGDRVSAIQVLGLAGGLVAIIIVAWPPRGVVGPGAGRAAVSWPLIVVAGVGFAGFFLGIHQAVVVSGATWWPLLAARGATVVVAVAASLAARPTRPGWRGVRGVAALLVVAGAADFGGNAFFLLASRPGYLSVAVVVSSLYPVATVLLAAGLLHERLGRWQGVGVALALASVLLIAL